LLRIPVAKSATNCVGRWVVAHTRLIHAPVHGVLRGVYAALEPALQQTGRWLATRVRAVLRIPQGATVALCGINPGICDGDLVPVRWGVDWRRNIVVAHS
jgi:hypothetical protein